MGIGIGHMVLEPKVGKENRRLVTQGEEGTDEIINILRVARTRYFVVKRRLQIWRI